MAQDTPKLESAENDEHHDEHFHEIAGIKVGESNVPASAIAVFIFIIALALLISWIPAQGF